MLLKKIIHKLNKPETLILDGRTVRDSIVPKLIEKVEQLKKGHPPIMPMLAIIQVGSRPDSTAFIRAKKVFAQKIGVKELHIQLPELYSEHQIIEAIKKCNDDSAITGIIVQLPLPDGVDRDVVINTIKQKKDVDGLTSANMELIDKSDPKATTPATARGISEIFDYYKISLANKKVVVIGRSSLVGTPIAKMCRRKGASVTVCHSKTLDLISETSQADIVISATGKINLVGASHVKEGAMVIDVGISRQTNGSLTGDVDFGAVKAKARAISPVPGGVGPMTVCALFQNLLELSY